MTERIRLWRWVQSLRPVLALRLAGKGLLRAPGTSLLAVAVLTLGLAAPATFFSLLVGATRPLPVPEGEEVIRAEVFQPSRGGRAFPVTRGDLRGLQGAGTLEGLGGFQTFSGTLVEPGRAAARFSGAALTPGVLALLRVSPALGRVPEAGEAAGTLLLGHDLWMETFGGDPGVLGRTVDVDGVRRTIVGVMPEGFAFPFHEEAWTLMDPSSGDSVPVELVGRLAAGASRESATAELTGLWAQGEAFRAPERSGARLRVKGFTRGRGEGGEGIAFLGLVLVAVALLLIACANVANLLLVRATERVRSLAVQAAVGGGRVQIGFQLFLEAVLVAMTGGAGGIFLAWAAVGAIQKALAAEHFGYYWMRMGIDGSVVAFTSVLVGGTAVLAGVLPVIRVLKTDLQGVLKEEAAGAAIPGGGRWGRGIVTTQLALSCGALVAAGLTGVSMAQESAFGRGIEGQDVLLASLTLPEDAGDSELASLEAALAGMPGAETVALAVGAPGFRERWNQVEIEGLEPAGPRDAESGLWNAVTPDYFPTFGLEPRSGRLLAATDGRGAPPVAVVSESFVRRFLPSGGNPLGSRLRVPGADSVSWFTVVGVVPDLELGGGPRERKDRLYLSLAQLDLRDVMVMARARSDVTSIPGELRRTLASFDPDIPVWSVRTLADAHAYLLRVPRAMATIALVGGTAGLLVAAVGLYGLLAFGVRQRRRELGLRLALGADGATLSREVLAQALRQLLPALAIGLALAWLAAPLIAVALLGGDPRSPVVYGGVALTFLAVGLAAAAAPARRAAGLEPARALRGD